MYYTSSIHCAKGGWIIASHLDLYGSDYNGIASLLSQLYKTSHNENPKEILVILRRK